MFLSLTWQFCRWTFYGCLLLYVTFCEPSDAFLSRWPLWGFAGHGPHNHTFQCQPSQHMNPGLSRKQCAFLQTKHSYRFTHCSLDVLSSVSLWESHCSQSDIMHAKVITTEVQSKHSVTFSSAGICPQIGSHPNSLTPCRAGPERRRYNYFVVDGSTVRPA